MVGKITYTRNKRITVLVLKDDGTWQCSVEPERIFCQFMFPMSKSPSAGVPGVAALEKALEYYKKSGKATLELSAATKKEMKAKPEKGVVH